MDKLQMLLGLLFPHALAFTILVVSVVEGSSPSSSNLISSSSSCSQTPYPEICSSFVTTTTTATRTTNNDATVTLDDAQFAFRHVMLRATIDQAERAHSLVSAMDSSSFADDRARTAWTDCLELYEDTMVQLNQSLQSGNSASLEDAQTWLSAAINNEQTCRNGFEELNLSSHLVSSPFMLTTNLSKLISNSLAINKAIAASSAQLSSSSSKKGSGGGSRRLLYSDNDNELFPTWVSIADRKLLQSPNPKADIVVAKDGSGNYKTISEAVAAVGRLRKGTERFVIHVKAGVYNENVEVKRSTKNLMLIGDGIDATIITGSRSVKGGWTTFRSATFAVTGGGFIARDITFENTAGPQRGQAVALRSGSDLSVFYGCSFKGYQDTLYVYAQRQFYRNCDIYGTIDFIFGDAVAVLQNCNIYVRRPMSGQWTTVTAQGRKDPNENTGISIHNSRVTAAADLRPVQGSVKVYLGRPWQRYSRTVFMKTYLDSLISPAGWLEWSGSFALSTLYYGEYMNTGGGADTSRRVRWPGYHPSMSTAEAGKFTVGSFLGGGSWIPATGVPFTLGI